MEKDIRKLEAEIMTLRIKKNNLETDLADLTNKRINLIADISKLQQSKQHFADESIKAQDEYLLNKKKAEDILKEAEEQKHANMREKHALDSIANEQKVKGASLHTFENSLNTRNQEQNEREKKQDIRDKELDGKDSILKEDIKKLEDDKIEVVDRKRAIISLQADIEKIKTEQIRKLDDIERLERQLEVKIKNSDDTKAKYDRETAKTAIINQQLETERRDNSILQKENKDKKAELDNREKSLDRIKAALGQKEDMLEILQLRFEKLAREKGMANELETLKKEVNEITR